MPGGGGSSEIRDSLRGDRRGEQGGEGDVIAVDCADIIGGIGRTWYRVPGVRSVMLLVKGLVR